MFRCPCCAKVWKLRLTGGYSLLAHKDLNRWQIVSEPVKLTGTFIDVKDLMDLAEKMDELGITFDFKGDNFLECPSCLNWSTFEAWHKAWNFPGDFFDADQLCGCGGELWYDKIPGTSRYALICEECGWVKPRAIISGHEGDLV